MGWQVSKGGITNGIYFWQKIDTLQENYFTL